MLTMEDLQRIGDASGARLEVVGGLTIWEASPVFLHQEIIFRIQVSIKPLAGSGGECGCVQASDVAVRFPDGSLKRPDIAIFCRRPDNPEQETTLLPEAVVEIISQDYEAKDLVIGIPFYLSQGVKDVLVLDPRTNVVIHARHGSRREYVSPVEIALECGCVCTV